MSASQSLTKDFFELIKGIGEAKSKQEEDRIILQEIVNLKRILAGPSSDRGRGHGNGGGSHSYKDDGFSHHSSPVHGRDAYGSNAHAHSSFGKATDRARDIFNSAKDAAQSATAAASAAASSNMVAGGPPPLSASKKRSREFLVRLMYVEMLGHDASFGYIKAVELAASSSILHKRTGYVTCGACLSPSHEFRFMLVNQLQRDLGSANVLEASVALLAVSRLITADMVPAVATEVSKLVHHGSDMVRKKSIFALHRLHCLDPNTVAGPDLVAHLRRMLCDRDPGVMGATLSIIESICCGTGVHSRTNKSRNPTTAALYPTATPFKDLVPSLVSILKQVCEHRLPSDYDYHRMPAPWIQMKIIRILGTLGRGDLRSSEGMYEILSDCMRRSDTGINVGYAVCYECVRTITTIYPNTVLLDAAADAISRFITSRNHNLKYIGVTGLAAIVKDHPKYAAQHQMSVIECLEDPDETLQRKTLDLLFRMTNPINVQFITDKLLQFLRTTSDEYLRRDLVTRIAQIAERYAPSNSWYVQAVTALFDIAGDLVRPDVAHNLMTLIAEGSEDNEEGDEDAIRREAVEMFVDLLDRPAAPSKILMDTMAWVLGEYAYLAEESLDAIVIKISALAQKPGHAPSTKKYLVAAIMKLVAQAGTCPPVATHVIDDFTRSRDVDLQQRCLEFQGMLATANHLLAEVLPVDASCEDIEADAGLSFLDAYVQTALANGAASYSPPAEDDSDDDDSLGASVARKPKFNITPYAEPTKPQHQIKVDHGGLPASNGAPNGTHGGNRPAPGPEAANTLQLRNVANVWGKPAPATGGAMPIAPAPAPTPGAGYGNPPSQPYGNPPSQPYGNQPYGTAAPAPSAGAPREMTEKERMAAALFGGIPGSGAPPPPTKGAFATSRPARTKPAPRAAPPAANPEPTPPPAPAPPAPAPLEKSMDLLDLGDFSPVPHTAAAPAPHDPFAAAPASAVPPPPPAPPLPAPAPAPPADPFAGAGLLGSSTDAPLGGLANAQPPANSLFQHAGAPLRPKTLSTPEFGQRWGSCPCTKMGGAAGSFRDLAQMMGVLETTGLHPVEAITATGEGILAGTVQDALVLLHGKMGEGGRVHFTVKGTQQGIVDGLVAFCTTRLQSS